MPDRKRRKSAAAMMMVAGGLAAAVTAPIDSALAQKGDALPLGQGTAEVQCNGFMPPDFFVVGKKLFFIGKDGTKTKAPDGKWQTHDRRVILTQNGVIISGALPQGRTTEIQCNE